LKELEAAPRNDSWSVRWKDALTGGIVSSESSIGNNA